MRKAAVAKKYRRLAKEAVENLDIDSGPWELSHITATFYHKTDRRRDDVNSLAMLKPAYDGIVEAGLLVDDDSKHLKTQTPMYHVDKLNPRVELFIERKK
jgi:hypothetical protein